MEKGCRMYMMSLLPHVASVARTLRQQNATKLS